MRFGSSQLCCLGSSAGRALCPVNRVAWVRIPPEVHFFEPWVCCVALPCLFGGVREVAPLSSWSETWSGVAGPGSSTVNIFPAGFVTIGMEINLISGTTKP